MPHANSSEGKCPKCGKRYAGMQFCPEDGVPLETPTSSPGDRYEQRIVDYKYRILKRLGKGGMGSVYEVETLKTGKIFALKILRQDLVAYSQAIMRFEREAAILSRLNHPHCVHIYDYGTTADGAPYLVMDMLHGQDLFEELRHARFFPPNRCIDISAQILSGLAEAHALGIIHRDLKPENVMLVKEGQTSDFVKVLDFGISKLITGARKEGEPTLSQEGSVFGTPEYMPPEQALAREVDHRSDLYSLGIIMFKMMAGRLPFRQREGDYPLTYQQAHCPPPRFNDMRMPQPIPPGLQSVLYCLLEKDPDKRYSDALVAREALLESIELDRSAASIPSSSLVSHDEDGSELEQEAPIRSMFQPYRTSKSISILAIAASLLGLIGIMVIIWFFLQG